MSSFNSFWSWLEACLSWFFPTSLLQDPLISLIIKGLEFTFGTWLLYILLMKPILLLFDFAEDYFFRK